MKLLPAPRISIPNITSSVAGESIVVDSTDLLVRGSKTFRFLLTPSKDGVISLGTLHNLRLFELETAVSEIERVGKNKYIMVEGYRTVAEMHNLECWALTAESILHTSEWIWLYNRFGYTGDYEFIYFE